MKQGPASSLYAQLARQAAAEGCVLVKNDREALPLQKGDHVAVFGRSAWNYYKSGLGSGGMVNTNYVIGILDALKESEDIALDQDVLDVYEDWMKTNPVDEGHGWGTVPWSQHEMPVSDAVVAKAAEKDTAAIVIIGRTAGEDQDNDAAPGSYLLTDIEEELIRKVSAAFRRSIILLNTGNIIDMKWVGRFDPAAVMYVWQGGQEGGNGVADVLFGKENPSGRLTDTIAKDIQDYPAYGNFGNERKNYYKEDIYVGYRYFETLAKENVLYPFGYGLSYTSFQIESRLSVVLKDAITVDVRVKNTGDHAGKEVVQIYVKAPQGRLGKPARVLAGFYKTPLLAPMEEVSASIVCPKSYFASFDDSGRENGINGMLLEEGTYEVFSGKDCRNAVSAGTWEQEYQIIEVCSAACAPVEPFERMIVSADEQGQYHCSYEEVPIQKTDENSSVSDDLAAKEIPYSGDCGYRLADVYEQKVTLDAFVGQLSDEDLISLFHGEGMCSSKVTAGIAGAFGGITKNLEHFGIPPIGCADGPSGIRMDCGTEAFSLPNGTALGCTFNTELAEELFTCLGEELCRNRIDVLLGPGINIHRHPLNGRNFEYVSEDPILTGKMAAAQLRGLNRSKIAGTIKHYCANNQEKNRTKIEAVVSQRALREIYLKVFEMAVKEGDARSVMTTYGPLNGLWTAGNFGLNTQILRNDWAFDGIVMTDWWGTANWANEEDDKTVRAPMVKAQNDVYMCCADAEEELKRDDVFLSLQEGIVQRGELQRNAKNILRFILKTPAMERWMHPETAEEKMTDANGIAESSGEEMFSFNVIPKDHAELVFEGDQALNIWDSNRNWGIRVEKEGNYDLIMEYSTESVEQAQIAISVYVDNIYRKMISLRGTEGEQRTVREPLLELMQGNHYVKLFHKEKGVAVHTIGICEKNI